MDFSWNKPSSYGDTHFKKPPWRAPPRLGNHATSLACWAGRKLCLGCGKKMLMRTQKDQKDQFLLSQNRSNSGYDLDHYSNSNDRYDLKIFKGFLGIEATSDCSEIVSISFMTIIGLLHDNHRWVSRKHGYNDQACASKSCLEAPTVAFERSSTLVWIHLNIHQEVPWYPKSNHLSSFFLLLFPVCIPFLDVDPMPNLQGYNILHVPLTVASGTEAQGRVPSRWERLGKGTKRIASTCESLQPPVLPTMFPVVVIVA